MALLGKDATPTMPAGDFFPVDGTITVPQIDVFFVLEVANRSVHPLGTTTNPEGRWTVSIRKSCERAC
jgi:hypothetical protein